MPRRTDILRVRLVAEGGGKVRADVLGVDDSFSKLEKRSASLSKGLRGLTGVFGVLSTAALASAVKGSLAFADSIDKAADRAGFGAEALQELRFAAEQVGVSTQQLDDGLRRFTRRIGVFANEGGGPAAKTFEQLGISIRDASGEVRNSEAILQDVVAELEAVESQAERSAIAAQLFGDDAGPQLRLLLDQGVAGLRSLRQEAQDIGAVLSDDVVQNAAETQDQFAKLANVLKVQFTTALVELGPILVSTVNGILKLTGAINDLFGLTKEAQVKNLQDDLDQLTERAQRLTESLKRNVSEIRKIAIIRELKETGQEIGEIKSQIDDLTKAAESEPLANLGADKGAEDAAKLNTELDKIIDRLNPLQARAKQYAAELAVITGSNLPLAQQAELVRKLNKEFADATGGRRKFADAAKKAGKDVAQTAQTTASEIQKPFDRAAENIQRAFGDTFTDIFRNGITRFEDLTDAIRDIFARLAGEIAALLVFQPSIVGGGLGGLGLFGSGAAAAGTGTAAGAGGFGGLLAGGAPFSPLALAALGGFGGILGGNAFSNAIGLNASRTGNIGGGLGALGGAYLGFALGGPFGSLGGLALGALAGGFGGSVLGNLFGGGGNDKQRFGFRTGTGGLQTPFGGLELTRSQNIDGGSILRSLQGIDEGIARLLNPEQIARVRESLAGTGQFFSSKTFDNEAFDVVFTRLTRTIDAVAQNTVASQLLQRIPRGAENVDQLVQEAARIIELINLFDDVPELNDAELALKAITDQFAELAQVADQLGFSVDDVNARMLEATQQLTIEFNESISGQILQLENNLQFLIEAEKRAGQERLENAKTLGADQLQVERLNALKLNRILEQQFGSSNTSIGRFLDSLKIGTAGGLSVADRLSNTEALFNSLLSSARTDPAARSELASLLPNLVSLKREQLGSTPEFFQFTNFLDSTLRNLVDQTDTVSTLNDIGSAITAGDNAIVEALFDTNERLTQEVSELRADIRLLMNAP